MSYPINCCANPKRRTSLANEPPINPRPTTANAPNGLNPEEDILSAQVVAGAVPPGGANFVKNTATGLAT